MTDYQTLTGTQPNAEEQHEPRTILRKNEDGSVYMMTEIADGTFVQWSNCGKCSRRVVECKCATGPVEPSYVLKWRTGRFTDSFTGRGAEPPLPANLKTRERVTDAVLRDLRGKGWTLLPPGEQAVKTEEDRSYLRDLDAPEPDVDDERDMAETEPGQPGHVPMDAWERGETVVDAPGMYDEPDEGISLSTTVDDGLDTALEAIRARAKEGEPDVGF